MTNSQNIIYGLRDPRTDSYKYIGKSTVGIQRAQSHFVHSHNPFVNKWVQELRKIGFTPFIDVLQDNLPVEELDNQEQWWVNFYQREGCTLFNVMLMNYKSEAEERLEKEVKKREEELQSRLTSMNNQLKELETIGGSLRYRRKMLNLRQKDAAELAKISLKTIANIENGKNVEIESVITYAAILGMKLILTIKTNETRNS